MGTRTPRIWTPWICRTRIQSTWGLGHLGYGHLGYAGLGYRVYGKRSAYAEAKPDPYCLAYGHGYGLGYAGHLGYGHLGYAGLGYGGYYLGKYIISRSFSEPSAESWTKMDCYQFQVPFTSAAVSVLP